MNFDTADKRTFARATVSGWMIKKDGKLGIKKIGMTWDDGEESMPSEIQRVLDEHRLG